MITLTLSPEERNEHVRFIEGLDLKARNLELMAADAEKLPGGKLTASLFRSQASSCSFLADMLRSHVDYIVPEKEAVA